MYNVNLYRIFMPKLTDIQKQKTVVGSLQFIKINNTDDYNENEVWRDSITDRCIIHRLFAYLFCENLYWLYIFSFFFLLLAWWWIQGRHHFSLEYYGWETFDANQTVKVFLILLWILLIMCLQKMFVDSSSILLAEISHQSLML